MNFKGHFKILEQPIAFTKVTIYSKPSDGGEDFIQKKYFYKNGKVLRIEDYLHDIISEYEYPDDNNYKVKFYCFENSITNKTFDSIKEFSLLNGQQVKEILIDIQENKEVKIYTGIFEYEGEFLKSETYKYSEDEIYKIHHEWNNNKTMYEIDHLGEPTKIKYTLDKNGFVLECLHFKYENSVKKTSYEYLNGKLRKIVEFPHLEYKKTLLGKIKIIGEAQFMNETEYHYHENGLLEKEVIKDYETKDIVDTTYYKYEK